MGCNERAWPQQCRKSCANGSNIVALRFGDHGTKEMLGVVGWKVWPVSNFAQQHATASNNMQQGVQTDATCNIQQYWELMANNVASVCTRHKSKELSYTRNPASYPEVSLLTLPMVPCGSSPVTRFALASAMRKTKRLRRRLPETHKFLVILSA